VSIYLARKVELAFWAPPANGFEVDELHVDALLKNKASPELRTTANALSFWRFEGSPDTWLKDAALAILGGWNDLNQGLALTWLEEQQVQGDGFALVPTSGNTRFVELQSHHVDVSRLDVSRLATLVKRLCIAIRASGAVKQFTRDNAAKLLAEAVDGRRIGLANLPKAVQDVIRPFVAGTPPR
jgi:hypothetical protein